jgi:uncharacterized YigZ family protein
MFTVDTVYSDSIEIKKSNFISYLIPFSQFDEFLEKLKLEHKKSRHIVWAYRYFNEFNQVVENSTDDGEPKNSSGKPTLKVIQGANLINVAILTVRYFGGIKLGVGGLVRAYTDSAVKVVEKAELIDLTNLYENKINVSYSLLRHAEHIILSNDVKITDKEFNSDDIILYLQGNEMNVNLVIGQIEEIKKSKYDI